MTRLRPAPHFRRMVLREILRSMLIYAEAAAPKRRRTKSTSDAAEPKPVKPAKPKPLRKVVKPPKRIANIWTLYLKEQLTVRLFMRLLLIEQPDGGPIASSAQTPKERMITASQDFRQLGPDEIAVRQG